MKELKSIVHTQGSVTSVATAYMYGETGRLLFVKSTPYPPKFLENSSQDIVETFVRFEEIAHDLKLS